MDRAALDPLVLDVVEQAIGSDAQFSLTYATQVYPGQEAPRARRARPAIRHAALHRLTR